jgi:hypothetical protein
MSNTNSKNDKREQAAQRALDDIRFLVDQTKSYGGEQRLDSQQLLQLLERNFQELDPNDNGISRLELTQALTNPGRFSDDEYVMLQLLAKYFGTISNMSDDEIAEETVITRTDCSVLSQFLIHSNLTIEQLHSWCSRGDRGDVTDLCGPPPLTSK